jgi:DMSO/TMAO reductase YedYZ heme-binding membrane subunit
MKLKVDYIIYGFGVGLVAAVFIYVKKTAPIPELQAIRLTDWYALIAVVFLYASLLASPLYVALPQLPGRATYFSARRSLGMSAFLFACLHSFFAFFLSLQGFAGLNFLPPDYRSVIGLGFASLTILLILTIVSFGPMKRYLGGRWQVLQKFVYLAGVMILVHAALIGSHFVNLGRTVPQLSYLVVFLLLFLESIRIRQWLLARYGKFAWVVWVLAVVLLLLAYYYLAFSNTHETFHVH